MNIPHARIDWLSYDQWTGSDKDFAKSIGMDPNNFAQYKRRRNRQQPTIVDVPVETVELAPTVTSAEDTAPHSADHSAELVILPDTNPPTVQGYALDSAETLADHETRLQVLESFVATLQAQAVQPPVQHITVQHSAYALHSAELG